MNDSDSQGPTRKALLFGLLFAAWMLPGLIGRDPWKADEAYSFGLVLNVLETGDLVVPALGSDPFMQKPPIFFLTSAAFAKAFSPPLLLHEAARLSCILYILLTLLSLGLSSREVNGPGTGWLAALLLMGSFGLLHTARMLQTDVSLLAGYTLALFGLVLSPRKPWIGGLVCGTGAGLAFLSKGLLGPCAIGVTVLCLPLFRTWRTRAWVKLAASSVAAALPWVLVWPIALYHRSPDLFVEWFWDNNFGRFLGEHRPSTSRLYYLVILPVFAFPAFPLAMWALWKERRTIFKDQKIQLVLLSLAVLLTVISLAGQKRALYATPLLVPLALLAARALPILEDRAVRVMSIAVLSVFSLLAGLIWFGWMAQFTGWPAGVLARIHAIVPGFVPAFHGPAFTVALLATFGWVLWIARRRRENSLVVAHWTSGLTLVYLLVMTLWLPVANGNMTYSHAFVGLRGALGENPGIIGSKGLGEPQRAMIHYYAGIKPLREETRGLLDCHWMLIQEHEQRGPRQRPPGPGWSLIWRGHHHRELFSLYHLDSVNEPKSEGGLFLQPNPPADANGKANRAAYGLRACAGIR